MQRGPGAIEVADRDRDDTPDEGRGAGVHGPGAEIVELVQRCMEVASAQTDLQQLGGERVLAAGKREVGVALERLDAGPFGGIEVAAEHRGRHSGEGDRDREGRLVAGRRGPPAVLDGAGEAGGITQGEPGRRGDEIADDADLDGDGGRAHPRHLGCGAALLRRTPRPETHHHLGLQGAGEQERVSERACRLDRRSCVGHGIVDPTGPDQQLDGEPGLRGDGRRWSEPVVLQHPFEGGGHTGIVDARSPPGPGGEAHRPVGGGHDQPWIVEQLGQGEGIGHDLLAADELAGEPERSVPLDETLVATGRHGLARVVRERALAPGRGLGERQASLLLLGRPSRVVAGHRRRPGGGAPVVVVGDLDRRGTPAGVAIRQRVRDAAMEPGGASGRESAA